MTELASFGVLVLLTIGVTEVIKRALKVPKTIIPAIALVVGLALTILGSITTITSLTFLAGIAVGLSAVGLFSQKDIIGLLK